MADIWRQTLREHVDTSSLDGDVTCDIVVIGGGYTGCSTALFAAEAGASVRLLEAGLLGGGASGRNVGLVTPGLWVSEDCVARCLGAEAPAFSRAMIDAHHLVFDLIVRHGIGCDARRCGTVQCARSVRELEALEARHRTLAAQGIACSIIRGAQVERRLGTRRFVGALVYETGGTVQPLSYCLGLARMAVSAGADLHERTPAVSVRREGGRWRVTTALGSVLSRALLVAIDAYARPIEGVPQPAGVRLPFFQVATAPLPGTLRTTTLPNGAACWTAGTTMAAFRTDADGRLIIGGAGAVDGPMGFVQRSWAQRQLADVFPNLGGLALEPAGGGLILMTNNRLPQITRLGPDGYQVSGFSGRGIGPGTFFGARLADVMTGANDESILPIHPVAGHVKQAGAVRQLLYRAATVAANAAATVVPLIRL